MYSSMNVSDLTLYELGESARLGGLRRRGNVGEEGGDGEDDEDDEEEEVDDGDGGMGCMYSVDNVGRAQVVEWAVGVDIGVDKGDEEMSSSEDTGSSKSMSLGKEFDDGDSIMLDMSPSDLVRMCAGVDIRSGADGEQAPV